MTDKSTDAVTANSSSPDDEGTRQTSEQSLPVPQVLAPDEAADDTLPVTGPVLVTETSQASPSTAIVADGLHSTLTATSDAASIVPPQEPILSSSSDRVAVLTTPLPMPATSYRAHLVRGEIRADYDQMWNGFHAAIRPEDAIEQEWVDDLADCAWERRRIRRQRDVLYVVHYPAAVVELTKCEFLNFVEDFSNHEEWAVNYVRERIADGRLTHTLVQAKAFEIGIDTFHAFENKLNQLSARQVLILREIREHRKHAKVLIAALQAVEQSMDATAAVADAALESRGDD